jgi:hypothetical protein
MMLTCGSTISGFLETASRRLHTRDPVPLSVNSNAWPERQLDRAAVESRDTLPSDLIAGSTFRFNGSSRRAQPTSRLMLRTLVARDAPDPMSSCAICACRSWMDLSSCARLRAPVAVIARPSLRYRDSPASEIGRVRERQGSMPTLASRLTSTRSLRPCAGRLTSASPRQHFDSPAPTGAAGRRNR